VLGCGARDRGRGRAPTGPAGTVRTDHPRRPARRRRHRASRPSTRLRPTPPDQAAARELIVDEAGVAEPGHLDPRRWVALLVVREAIIEGIGASLMLPSTLAILSTTFKGRERATAFAAWGATAGVAAAFGPVVGGFLTSNYSWRWSFRINVIIAPLAVLGALLFMKRAVRTPEKIRIDLPGALLIASGMVFLVFALRQ